MKMNKIINFNDKRASLSISTHNAVLSIDEYYLPVGLADAINEVDSVDVIEVLLDKKKMAGMIGIVHNLNPNKILEVICEAITKFYNTDITVSNVRPSHFPV